MRKSLHSILTGITIGCLAMSVDGGLTGCAYAQQVKANLSTPASKAALADAAKVIGGAAVTLLANAAVSEISAGKLNFQSGAGTALFGLATSLGSSGDLATILSAFKLPKSAAVAASIVSTANSNPKPTVISAIAAVVSAAAGAPPANPAASIAAA